MSNAIDLADLSVENGWARLNTASADNTASRPVPTYAHPLTESTLAPHTISETGLDPQMLVELTAKAVFTRGTTELLQLVDTLKLTMSVIDEITGFMIRDRLLEITRRGAARRISMCTTN
jgi:hypothetical protein